MNKQIRNGVVLLLIAFICAQGAVFSANTAPTVVSVSPSPGSAAPGVWQTFTCTYSDVDTAADLTSCRLLINTTASASGAAYFNYNKAVNKFYMFNNAAASVGGIVKGTATTIESENAILDCGATTVTASGNNVVIAWRVQFKPTMAGKNCNIYMFDQDKVGANSKWIDKGDLLVKAANTAPTATSVSPNSGSVAPGVWQTFTCTYSDVDTAADITGCRLLINTSASASGAAYFNYNKVNNKLYMFNNAAASVGGIVRGTAGTIETENAILDCGATTVTTSGNNLVIAWRVQFKPTMAGKNCNIYMLTQDAAGANSKWVDRGDISIKAANTAPTVVSVSPNSGSVTTGTWQTFTCTYSDVDTAADLTNCKMLINTTASASGAAYFYYNKTTNKLYVYNNAAATVGGIVRGTAGTIQSENAILDCGATTATVSGNNLVIAWRVQFKPTMAGKNCNIYMFDQDTVGANSKWIDKGDLLVKAVNTAPTVTSVSPNSGSVATDVWQTFTCTYSDVDTAADLTNCKMIINTTASASGAAYFCYNKTVNKLYMYNNAAATVGGIVKGTTGTIETENAILDCGATTATASGNNLVIAWRVKFKPVMEGLKCNIYMLAQDSAGANSGWGNKGTCNVGTASASTYIESGKARINSVVTMEPFNATTAKTLMQQAKDFFQQAKTLENTNAQANFGLAITDAALTAQSIIDKYQGLFEEGGTVPASLKYTATTLQFMNLPDLVKPGKEPLNAVASSYTNAVTSPQFEGESPDPQLMLDIQTDIKNVVRPMLSRVGGYLDIVEANGGSSFTFPIGTQTWDGYTIVDLGDVYLFHGALLATRWALAIPASYNVNIGTFDFSTPANEMDANHDGLLTPSEYLPASPFLNLTDSATMTGAKADMTTAADKIIAGITSTLAETTDNYDLIRWHTPDEGPTLADLLAIKDYAADLKASMNGPVTITWESEDGPASMDVFLGKWNTNPPASLKTLMPTQEVERWYDWYSQSYQYSTEAISFPDNTFGGMFPDGLSDILGDRSLVIDTDFTGGSLSGLTTYPANGATNVSTEYQELSVTFSSYPPTTFSITLQRYFAGQWRDVRIGGGWTQWNNDSEYFFYPVCDLWPNNNYRIIVKDENTKVSVTRSFTTGADAPQ